MAMNAQKVFHDGTEFYVTKLGNPNLELKKEQHDVISAICMRKEMYCVANWFREIPLLSSVACDF